MVSIFSLCKACLFDLKLLVAKVSQTQKTFVGLINSKESKMAIDIIEEPVLLPEETYVVAKPLEMFERGCVRVLSLRAVCHMWV